MCQELLSKCQWHCVQSLGIHLIIVSQLVSGRTELYVCWRLICMYIVTVYVERYFNAGGVLINSK